MSKFSQNLASGKISTVLMVVVTLVLVGGVGYWLGVKKGEQSQTSPTQNVTAQLPTSKIAADSLITSQEAIAVGKIVKTDQGSITMQAKDGKIGGFKLAPSVNIYPLSASGSATKASNDINTIKLNENYLVHLVLQGSEFIATTVQALPTSTK